MVKKLGGEMSKPKPTANSTDSSSSKSKTASTKTTKSTTNSTTKAKKKATPKKAAAPTTEPERTAAEKAYIEATIARGEAQPAGPSGELPEGATHELIETPSGEQIIRRRRFSAA